MCVCVYVCVWFVRVRVRVRERVACGLLRVRLPVRVRVACGVWRGARAYVYICTYAVYKNVGCVRTFVTVTRTYCHTLPVELK